MLRPPKRAATIYARKMLFTQAHTHMHTGSTAIAVFKRTFVDAAEFRYATSRAQIMRINAEVKQSELRSAELASKLDLLCINGKLNKLLPPPPPPSSVNTNGGRKFAALKVRGI